MTGLAWAELGDDLLVRQYILDRSESNKPHDIEPPTSTTLTVALLYLMHRTAKDTVSIAPRARVLDPSSTKTTASDNALDTKIKGLITRCDKSKATLLDSRCTQQQKKDFFRQEFRKGLPPKASISSKGAKKKKAGGKKRKAESQGNP
jgi:hypothetical protein